MKKFPWQLLFNSIIVVFCVLLIIFFIFSENGLLDLVWASSNIQWYWIAAALFCHICNASIDVVLTWQFVRQKYKQISFKAAFKTAVVGHFFSAVTPGGSGGQPMQVFYLHREGVDVGFASSMLIQKFAVFQICATLYAVFLFAFKSRFILSQIKGTWMIAFCIVGFLSQILVMAFILLSAFMPKLLKKLLGIVALAIKRIKPKRDTESWVRKTQQKINTFYISNKRFLKNPKLIVISFVEVTVQITFIYSVPYFVYKALVPEGSGEWFMMLCAVAFVTIVSSMIPLPGASGVSELAFSVFFRVFFTQTTLKSAILIWRVITYYLVILFGAPFSLLGKKEKRKN